MYRIGGDEFAVILAGATEAGVRAGERILQAARLQRRGRDLPTLSGGVAQSAGVESKQELLARADAALYQAKDAGGDKILAAGIVAPRKQRASAGQKTAPSIEVAVPGTRPLKILLVDDDPGLLVLLRTTFEIIDIDVEETHSAAEAQKRIETSPPDVIVLDVAMPVTDGLFFCRSLKSDPATREIPVIVLSGSRSNEDEAKKAGAEAFLAKPFSPARPARARRASYRRPVRRTVHTDGRRPAGGTDPPLRPRSPPPARTRARPALPAEEGLRGDDRRVRRRARGEGFRHGRALEASGSLRHGAHACDRARLLDDPSLEYGFLLHDVGKIGIPDSILQKPGALTREQRTVMRTHAVVGVQLLSDVPLLQGEGLGVIRSHHERWDGSGYPDLLGEDAIPLGGRIFAVADTLDAMTSERPYRAAFEWGQAVDEIVLQSGRQFDPQVVGAFRSAEPKLRRIHQELAAA